MEKIDSNSDNLFPTYFTTVKNIRELAKLSIPTQSFTILLCADFRDACTEDVLYIAETFLGKGIKYFCAWGPDCQRAHDVFDEVIYQNNIDELIMTTWHDKESLEDTLWFALYLANVAKEYSDDCCTIIVTVNNSLWKEKICKHLSDIDTFKKRLLAEDN